MKPQPEQSCCPSRQPLGHLILNHCMCTQSNAGPIDPSEGDPSLHDEPHMVHHQWQPYHHPHYNNQYNHRGCSSIPLTSHHHPHSHHHLPCHYNNHNNNNHNVTPSPLPPSPSPSPAHHDHHSHSNPHVQLHWNPHPQVTSSTRSSIRPLTTSIGHGGHGSTTLYPSFVKIVEVGPRDGLQAEKTPLSTDTKVNFINLLSQTGLKVIEATSFVHPQLVPQMADGKEVFSRIQRSDGINYPVLVPNLSGLKRALEVGVEEIAVFGAASDSFSLKNINCTSEQSLVIMESVVKQALSHGIKVRGYISCVLGCPYEGEISAEKVAKIAQQMHSYGCYEISLGDTIGVGTPASMRRLLQQVTQLIPIEAIAVHCHDTYGQALPNILTALEFGVHVVDSSVTGLGGCPFAEGATGNVSTEDVVYMLHGMGIKTGVDMDKLLDAGELICSALGRPTNSKAGKAIATRNKFLQQQQQQQQTQTQQQQQQQQKTGSKS